MPKNTIIEKSTGIVYGYSLYNSTWVLFINHDIVYMLLKQLFNQDN